MTNFNEEVYLLSCLLSEKRNKREAVNLSMDLLKQYSSIQDFLKLDKQALWQQTTLYFEEIQRISAIWQIIRFALKPKQLDKQYLNSSSIVKNYLISQLTQLKHEVFACVFLDVHNVFLGFDILFEGTVNSSYVYPRRVIEYGIKYSASKVIIAHNHPSGKVEPSDSDIELTKELKKLLILIDIELLDHIIVGEVAYSFVEQNAMP